MDDLLEHPPSSVFKLNVSHLELADFQALVHQVKKPLPFIIGYLGVDPLVGGCCVSHC